MLPPKGPLGDCPIEGAGGKITTYDNALFAEVNVLNREGTFIRNIKLKGVNNPCGTLRAVDWTKYKENWKKMTKKQKQCDVEDLI